MSVRVKYHAQRGNQLFQYCLGRILAEERGLALVAKPIAGFPATETPVAGKVVRLPWTRLKGHRIDMAGLLADPRRRCIIVDGYFLNYTYYAPYVERVRRWVGSVLDTALPPALDLHPAADDLLVMVRLTDFVKWNAALRWSYFEAVLRQAKFGKLYVTSDEMDHPFLRRFAPYQAQMIDAGPLDTLRLAARFGKLAISNSTFGWWAAFLGQADAVWMPFPSVIREGAWAVNRFADGVDLRIDDPRYRYVYGVTSTGAEGLHADVREPAGTLLPLAAATVAGAESIVAFHQKSSAYWLDLGQPRAIS